MNLFTDAAVLAARSFIVMLCLGGLHSIYEVVPPLGYWTVVLGFLVLGSVVGAISHGFWAMRSDLEEVGRI